MNGHDWLRFTGKPSFKIVTFPYLERGKKSHNMSNHPGNVIDSLEFIKGAALNELKNKFKLFDLSPAIVSPALAGQRDAYA